MNHFLIISAVIIGIILYILPLYSRKKEYIDEEEYNDIIKSIISGGMIVLYIVMVFYRIKYFREKVQLFDFCLLVISVKQVIGEFNSILKVIRKYKSQGL